MWFEDQQARDYNLRRHRDNYDEYHYHDGHRYYEADEIPGEL
jgi:hypothetical protein